MIRGLLFGPVNLTGHYGREEDVLMIRPATITILAIRLIEARRGIGRDSLTDAVVPLAVPVVGA